MFTGRTDINQRGLDSWNWFMVSVHYIPNDRNNLEKIVIMARFAQTWPKRSY